MVIITEKFRYLPNVLEALNRLETEFFLRVSVSVCHILHRVRVIKPLSKYITCDYGVFIAVTNGTKIIKKSTKNCESCS